ncbi:MAG: hypothetical protein IPI67_22105 [Myxococcales bacterium]|nr:hypothetical protein [Myxococcales bacterium]
MLLEQANPARLELGRRTGFGAPVLTALVIGAFSLSPLLAPGPVSVARAAFALFLAAFALALAVIARPRERSLRIALDAGVIDLGARTTPLGRARFITLGSGGSTLEASVRTRYRAEIALDGDDRVVLLEDPDPARVLSDLRRVLSYWPIPVTTGWGLPLGAEPWLPAAVTAAPVSAGEFEAHGRPYEAELGAGLSVLGGAAVVGTAMALMHGSRLANDKPTALLSYALSALLLGFIVVLGALMVSDRLTLRVQADSVTLVRTALGVVWRRRVVPTTNVRGLYAVGLIPNEPRHLLVCTEQGIEAFPVVGEAATRMANHFATSKSEPARG